MLENDYDYGNYYYKIGLAKIKQVNLISLRDFNIKSFSTIGVYAFS